jgi:hypothetical protein
MTDSEPARNTAHGGPDTIRAFHAPLDVFLDSD